MESINDVTTLFSRSIHPEWWCSSYATITLLWHQISQNTPNHHSGWIDQLEKVGIPFLDLILSVVCYILWGSESLKMTPCSSYVQKHVKYDPLGGALGTYSGLQAADGV